MDILGYMSWPVCNVIVNPAHGGTEHLVLWVHPQILRGYELRQEILVDLVELLLLTDQVEVVVDVVEGDVPETLDVVTLGKPIDSWLIYIDTLPPGNWKLDTKAQYNHMLVHVGTSTW